VLLKEGKAHIYNGTRNPNIPGNSYTCQYSVHVTCSLLKAENWLGRYSACLCIPYRHALLFSREYHQIQNPAKDDPYYNLADFLNKSFVLVYRLDGLFPIKLPEKRLIRLYSLLYVWKSYLSPLLICESLGRGHDILYLRRLLVRRRLGIRSGNLPAGRSTYSKPIPPVP
jgi:hypothetical protein